MLEVRELRAGYGDVEVLHGIDLVVPTGRTVALLGSNGAGKTTLLASVAGLLPARAGTITLDGRQVTRRSAHRRTRAGICLLPEGRGIFRQLTVRQNIAMFVGGRDVDEALERAGALFPKLTQRARQVAGTLSGGEQQMLSVTRAIITDAPVVLADELSVGLAPKVVDEIFEVVDQLRSEGRSLLIVEQYADRALAVADYVYLLAKGQIAFVGEPAQLANDELFHRYLGQASGHVDEMATVGVNADRTRRRPLRGDGRRAG
jgi:branched-chain amino acid transport system ATP-binding protein